MEIRAVDCCRCRHHYITWRMPRRYGCRAFGFESQGLPALEVLHASGKPCHLLEPRAERAERGPADSWRAPRAGE